MTYHADTIRRKGTTLARIELEWLRQMPPWTSVRGVDIIEKWDAREREIRALVAEVEQLRHERDKAQIEAENNAREHLRVHELEDACEQLRAERDAALAMIEHLRTPR